MDEAHEIPADEEVRGLLLAGGRSRRMGRDKRLLAIGDETMVAHAFRALYEAFGQPWVLVADESDVAILAPTLGPSTRFLIDRVPGAGPLSALADALDAIDRPYAFLLAMDMPRVTSAFLRDFDGLRRHLVVQPEALVPRDEGFTQVTCAFYQRSLGPALGAAVRTGRTSLTESLERSDFDVRYLAHDELRRSEGGGVFHNLNTPDDHARYLRGRGHAR